MLKFKNTHPYAVHITALAIDVGAGKTFNVPDGIGYKPSDGIKPVVARAANKRNNTKKDGEK